MIRFKIAGFESLPLKEQKSYNLLDENLYLRKGVFSPSSIKAKLKRKPRIFGHVVNPEAVQPWQLRFLVDKYSGPFYPTPSIPENAVS